MSGKTFVELEGVEQAAYVEKYKEKFKSKGETVKKGKFAYTSISKALDPKHYKLRPIKPQCELTFKLDSTTPFEALYFGFITAIESDLRSDLRKLDEQWYASEIDTRWGEIQQKKASQQQQASQLLQAIGISTKAINQSMADRIETKKFLDIMKDSENTKDPEKQKETIRIQKSLWLDNVDIKKGRSSIYQMAQDLSFYMLPDYFIKTETVEEIQKDTTLSDRYKNILAKKLTEFLEWRKYWKENLKLTEKIAIEQLARDLSMIVLYKKQLRPVLENIKRLEFMSGDPASVYASMDSDVAVNMLAGVPVRMTTVKLSSGLSWSFELKKEIKPVLKKYWIFNFVGVEATGANNWYFQINATGYLLTPWECCLQQRSIEDTSLKKEIDDYIEGVAGTNDIAELEEVAKLARELGLDFKLPDEKVEEKPKSDEGGLRLLDRLFEGKPSKDRKSEEGENKKTPEYKSNENLKKCVLLHKKAIVPKTEYVAEQKKLQEQIDKIMAVFKNKFNLA